MSETVILDRQIASSADDGEEWSSGRVRLNSSDLELGFDRNHQQVAGLRFTDLGIPQGAVISAAYLQFTTDETDSGDAAFEIRGVDADDAAAFTSAKGDLSSRPSSDASVAWAPPAWDSIGEAGPDQRSPDLTAIVQEVVDRPGWAPGNDMAFLVSGTGARVADSFDGSAAGAPLLHIEYGGPDLPGGGDAAIRFAAFGDYGSREGEPAVAQLVDSLDVDFIVTTGDNTYGSAPIDDQIGQYYSDYIGNYQGDYGAGSATARFFPSLGNHEYSDPAGGDNASNYLEYFTLPGNERYYDFTAGPVHFFALNSNSEEPDGRSSTSEQAQWLKAELASSTSPFNIVFFHHPPYSSGAHGSTEVMQWPFEEWGATAVLNGHEHSYERILRDDNDDGVVMPYIVAGLGGADPRGFDDTPVAGSAEQYNDNYGTLLVEASESSITFDFISVENGGTLIDSYTIDLAQDAALASSGAVAGSEPAVSLASEAFALAAPDLGDLQVNSLIA